MALPVTMHTVELEISDVDRGVYRTETLRIARHSSETAAYMATRLLAYGLEYAEGIAFTEGIGTGDQPALWIKDLTGRVTAWIEVGKPDPRRLHRGVKLAGRAAVYTHRRIEQVLAELQGQGIHRAAEIPVIELPPAFVDRLAERLTRRSRVALSVTERHLYVEVDGESLDTPLADHRFT